MASKLEMIIEMQERKMHIEIFGEKHLDCNDINRVLKSNSGKKVLQN